MHKTTKLLSVILAAAMVVCMLAPLSAFADSNVAAIGDAQYATLEAAVDAAQAGDTVKLLADITKGENDSVAVWGKGFNLDLNGHTFTTDSKVGITNSNNGYTASAICFGDETNVPNPTRDISLSNGTIRTAYGAGVYADGQNLTMTLSDLDVKQNYPDNVQTTDEYSTAVRLTGNATVIIESGRYEGKHAIVVSNSGGSVIVNGGTFKGNIFISSSQPQNAKTVTIYGGTFDHDPTAYVAEGYKAVNNGNGTWTVMSKYVAQIGETKYETLDAAADAANPGDTIVLLDDITYGTDRVVPVWGKDFNIDLNGYTLITNSNQSITLSNNGYKATAICFGDETNVPNPTRDISLSNGTIRTAYGAGVYADGQNLTMTLSDLDVKQNYPANVQSTDEYSTAVRLTGNATVIIESGRYEGKHAIVVSNSGGSVIVNGGTFVGDIFIAPTTSAGAVKSVTIYGGTFDHDPTAYVAEGYKAVNNGNGTWTVESRYVAQIGNAKYETLSAAVAALEDGDTIELLADIDFSTGAYVGYKWAGSTYNPLTITKNNVTLDLAGHTISNMGNVAIAFGNILAADGRISNATIKNGTLLAGKTNNVTNSYVLAMAGVDGALIKNVTTNGGINVYTGAKDVVIDSCNVNGTKYYAVCAQTGSDVVIKNSTFTKNTDSTVETKAMFWVDKAGSDSDVVTSENPTGAYGASSITIESGDFTVDSANGGIFYLTSGLKPVVKGGTFNFDPSAYVADGYEAIDNNDGTYTVGEVKASEPEIEATPAAGYDVSYTVKKQVVDANNSVITEGDSRTTVNIKTVTENTVYKAETASEFIDNLDMNKVLDSVVASADAGDTVNVEIKVVCTEPEVVNETITYEVHPEAIVSVNDNPPETVRISNDALGENAVFTIRLDVPDAVAAAATNGNIKVIHKSVGYDDEINTYPLQGDLGNYFVEFNVTHFSEFVVAANGSLFTGHSVTLNGYINLNFYLDLYENQVTTGEGTVVNFTWNRGSASHTVALGDYVVGKGYKATVALPAAEMTYGITATVVINGIEQAETNTYSVRQYADELLAISDPVNDAKLIDLVNAMLDYGAKAQIAFGRTDVDLANYGIGYDMPYYSRGELLDMIDAAIAAANNGAHATVLRDFADAIGADAYYSSSLIYLSGCTLRHYFFGYGLDESKFDGVKQDYFYYVDKENIAAADLDKLQTFTVGDDTFFYSALDFVKAIVYNYESGYNYDLAVATYWYNQAANAYFE